MFHLKLFGGARIEGPDGVLAGRVAQRRQLALLAFLAVQRDRPASRDKLLGLLWPEAGMESARHSLADAIYVIRKALGESAVLSVGDDVSLDTEHVRSDVCDFEDALARGDQAGAVATYTGPLLDGFHLPGSHEFDHWLELERTRLARACLDALEGMAHGAEAAGDWLAAVERWRQAARFEPHNSRLAMKLMGAMAKAGDRAGAVRIATAHAALLKEEFGVEPDAELLACTAELRGIPGDHDPLAATSATSTPDDGSPAASAAPPPHAGHEIRSPTDDRGQPPGPPSAGVRPVRMRPVAVWTSIGAVVVLAAGIYAGARDTDLPRAALPGLDSSAAVVIPFRISGADSAVAYLREGLVDLLAAKLTGDGSPRAVDPRSVLRAWSEAVRTDQEDLPVPAAARLARELGAGSVLVGSVVGTPANLALHAAIVDARTGDATGSATVQGTEHDLHGMVDALVAQLLSRSAGEAEHRIGHLTSTSLPALRMFLRARAAHRHGDYESALRLYGHALDLDSTFALAGLGLTLVGGWVGGSGPAEARGRDVAIRYRDRLSERDRVGLTGRLVPRAPDQLPSALESLEAIEAAQRRWPDHAVLWYRRGDVYFHLGAALGMDAWAARARESFERAIDLDPDYAEPVHHLASTLGLLGDTAALLTLASYQLERRPTGPVADHLRWRVRHALGDPSAFADLPLDAMDTDATLRWIGIEAQDYGFGITDGARAVELRLLRPGIRDELLERRLGAMSYALNRGRPVEALAHLRVAREVQPDPGFDLRLIILTALYADGDRNAARRAADDLATTGVDGALEQLNRCVLAQWQLVADESTPGALDPSARSVLERPLEPGARPVSRRICRAVLEAQSIARTGAGSDPAAVERLDALLATGPNSGLVDDGHTEYAHLALARLYEGIGNPAAALRAVRRRAVYHGWQPYLAEMLRMEGRLAAALGDTAGAVAAYEHYLAFRDDPAPPLRGAAERVRTALHGLREAAPVRR